MKLAARAMNGSFPFCGAAYGFGHLICCMCERRRRTMSAVGSEPPCGDAEDHYNQACPFRRERPLVAFGQVAHRFTQLPWSRHSSIAQHLREVKNRNADFQIC